jgi:VanZ family protein
MRLACLAYVVFLSLLLLSPNPARVIGVSGELPWLLRTLMPYAHLLSFSVLAVLMLLARWPLPRWSIVLLLAAYGGATEIIQGFVPPRTPEWADWFQDVGGVAAGTAVCSLVALLLIRVSHYVRRTADGDHRSVLLAGKQ